MKKIIIFVTLVLLLSACGSGEADERTLEDIIQVYENEGIEVDRSEKPYYEIIGADNGVIFYIDGSPVKIYKYDSIKSLNTAKSDIGTTEADSYNGRFWLETNNEQAKEIFSSIN